MNENENLVTEQVAENVETTTEQTPKTYTEAEFNTAVNTKVNEVLGKKIARREAKIRKEYDQEYGDLVETLKAGTGKSNVKEITGNLKQFYQSKGIKMPNRAEYSAQDIEVLARAEADEVIRGGYDEVVEEVDRLANLDASEISPREKAVFRMLAEHRDKAEKSKELSSIGVTEDVYNSDDFKEFAAKFNSNTPIKDVYDIYIKTQPRKEFKTMGSMKNKTSDDGTVKDFYTRDEALKFTKADFDKNPALFKAVEQSMLNW